MKDFFLFIDTEASGLPKKWNAPFSQVGNWPYAVQISWLIYTKEGEPVKWENHYINDDDFQIAPSAFKIHGITRSFLLQQGESRRKILTLLTDDIQQYQPLIVGHFMKFDALVLGADYFRMGLESPINHFPTFCTMKATTGYVRNPRLKYLRLGDLYYLLFNATLEQQHNALVDARATADCFFELVKRGDINLEQISQETLRQITKKETQLPVISKKKLKYSLLALMLFLSAILLYYWL